MKNSYTLDDKYCNDWSMVSAFKEFEALTDPKKEIFIEMLANQKEMNFQKPTILEQIKRLDLKERKELLHQLIDLV